MNSNKEVFFTLVRAGLWEGQRSVQGLRFKVQGVDTVDWSEVYRIAEEQSVVGLVAAGIDWFRVHDSWFTIPQEWALQFIGQTLQLEQRNRSMNEFVARLIEKLRKEDVYAVLVKGQGIARCYERSLWRASGDVDLLLSKDNYEKAKRLLKEKASSVDEEDEALKHLAMIIEGWSVELHGTLHTGLWTAIDRGVDEIQNEVFYGGNVRSEDFSNLYGSMVQVFLPKVDEDVVLIFAHILQHFFKEGIGLRQICDWCRLLWIYKDSLDISQLEKRVHKMGIMTEWKAFAAFAVKYLGMPVEALPLFNFNDNANFKKKADRILEFVMETGNFGHNRDYLYYEKYSYWSYKIISFLRHTKDTIKYMRIFPVDSIKIWSNMLIHGIGIAAKGK